jgi:hypothetical protein
MMFGRRAGLSTCFSDVRCTVTVGSSDILDLAIGAAKSDAAKSKASVSAETQNIPPARLDARAGQELQR